MKERQYIFNKNDALSSPLVSGKGKLLRQHDFWGRRKGETGGGGGEVGVAPQPNIRNMPEGKGGHIVPKTPRGERGMGINKGG